MENDWRRHAAAGINRVVLIESRSVKKLFEERLELDGQSPPDDPLHDIAIQPPSIATEAAIVDHAGR